MTNLQQLIDTARRELPGLSHDAFDRQAELVLSAAGYANIRWRDDDVGFGPVRRTVSAARAGHGEEASYD